MAGMSRTTLVILVAALAVGIGLGLYLGWVVSPVQYVDTAPNTLQRAFKDDYILMIATAYAGDGDVAAARAQLDSLGLGNAPVAVSAAEQRLAAAGLPETDQRHLSTLARALDTQAGPAATSTAAPPTPSATTAGYP